MNRDHSISFRTSLRFWIKGRRQIVFCTALMGLLFVLCLPANAQRQPKLAKIGELLFRDDPGVGPGRAAFRQQLRELGYLERKNNLRDEIRSGKVGAIPRHRRGVG